MYDLRYKRTSRNERRSDTVHRYRPEKRNNIPSLQPRRECDRSRCDATLFFIHYSLLYKAAADMFIAEGRGMLQQQ